MKSIKNYATAVARIPQYVIVQHVRLQPNFFTIARSMQPMRRKTATSYVAEDIKNQKTKLVNNR